MEQAFVVSVPALMEHLLYTGCCVKGFMCVRLCEGSAGPSDLQMAYVNLRFEPALGSSAPCRRHPLHDVDSPGIRWQVTKAPTSPLELTHLFSECLCCRSFSVDLHVSLRVQVSPPDPLTCSFLFLIHAPLSSLPAPQLAVLPSLPFARSPPDLVRCSGWHPQNPP